MFSARRVRHTYEDYLALEQGSPIKHEYCDGEIYAMAGGTPEHGALAAAVIAQLRGQLPVDCTVFSSDVKVRVEASDLSTYPDVSVVCGKLVRDAKDPTAITNPMLLVEVTSPSSKDYDRGEKLSHYTQLASLRFVLIVAHDARRLTVVSRESGTWSIVEYRGGAHARMGDLSVDVDALYAVLAAM
jgi:Uma2 family endonuclease